MGYAYMGDYAPTIVVIICLKCYCAYYIKIKLSFIPKNPEIINFIDNVSASWYTVKTS